MATMPIVIDGKRYAVRSIPRNHVLEETSKKSRMEREQLNSMLIHSIHPNHPKETKRECCMVM